MKLKTIIILLISFTLMVFGVILNAETILTKEMKTDVITKLSKAIEAKYVLVAKGKEFSQELINRNNAGDFTNSIEKDDFIKKINTALYDISNDKHLSLRSESSTTPSGPTRRMVRRSQPSGGNATSSPGPKRVRIDPSQDTRSLKKLMGFPDTASLQTEILTGNVGLLTVKNLMGSINEVNSAMANLSKTDGIIIDVRQCPGGRGDIANQISSYFMPEGEIIMKHHTRGEDVRISKSMPLPKGISRYKNKPVYIVTSDFTGSACETLAFALKYHNRAIILGEKTAGAGLALTQALTPVGLGLAAFIPNSAPEHPKYKGGFEKVGVSVDISSNSAVAIKSAHQMVLSQLLSIDVGNTLLAKAMFETTQELNKSLLTQVQNSRTYGFLLGRYGVDESLIFDNGQLKFATPSGRKYPLQKIANDLFSVLYMRGQRQIRINRNKNNAVIGISLSPKKSNDEWTFKMKKT